MQSYCDSSDPYCCDGSDEATHQGYGDVYGQDALTFIQGQLDSASSGSATSSNDSPANGTTSSSESSASGSSAGSDNSASVPIAGDDQNSTGQDSAESGASDASAVQNGGDQGGGQWDQNQGANQWNQNQGQGQGQWGGWGKKN